jgi:hypothetical protein
MIKLSLTFVILLVLLSPLGWGVDITAVKITTPPTIDGVLDDAVWKVANSVTDFVVFPGATKKATNQTVAMIAYDDANLYVAYHCEEPNTGKLKTVVKDRDGSPIWNDDEIELFIDTEGDGAAPYFQFIVNAANVQFDMWKGKGDVGWNGKWTSEVKVGTDAWDVEILIPFSDLGTTPKPGDTWGVNFTRHVMTVSPDEWTTWSPIAAGGFHQPQLFGKLNFGEAVTPVNSKGKLATTWGAVKE